MVLAADYPFMDVLWTMIIFFVWIMWIWMMIAIFSDIFRRRDIGGGAKAAWCFFLIILPFLGVFIYLISQHDGMAERQVKEMETAKQQTDAYIRSVAGSPTAEIAQAKELLDTGAISQTEFDAIKTKALAAA